MMQFVFASLLRFVDVRKFHEHSLSKNGTLQLNASKIYEKSKWKEVKYANLFCIVSYYIYRILRYAYAKSYCTFILIKCIELIILQVFFRSMVWSAHCAKGHRKKERKKWLQFSRMVHD